MKYNAETLQSCVDFMEKSAAKFKKNENRQFIIVSHILPNLIPLIDVLSKHGKIAGIIPKSHQPHNETIAAISQRDVNLLDFKKEDCTKKNFIKEHIVPIIGEDIKTYIIDMGGYFAPALKDLNTLPNVVGIVEDTENGLQKYENIIDNFPDNKIPVATIARSYLKDGEDHLIGKAIAQSAIKVLKEDGKDYRNLTFGVIGLGEVGLGAANYLQNQLNLDVKAFDKNHTKNKAFKFRGISAKKDKDDVLLKADVLICATGNKSLAEDDIVSLKPGCYIASCTSADDEFGAEIDKIRAKRKDITFINDGNAANMLYPDDQSKAIFPYIYLTMTGLIECAVMLEKDDKENRHYHVLDDKTERSLIVDFENIIKGTPTSKNFVTGMRKKGLSANPRG